MCGWRRLDCDIDTAIKLPQWPRKTKPWRPNQPPSASPPPPVSQRRAREGSPNSFPAASTRCSRWKRHATNSSSGNKHNCPLFPVPEVTCPEPHKHRSSSHSRRPLPSLPPPPTSPSSRGARPAGPSSSRTASSSPNGSSPPTSGRQSSAAFSEISTCEFFSRTVSKTRRSDV